MTDEHRFDVEFHVEPPGSDPDEELEPLAGPALLRTRRRRLIAGGVVLAALVAAITVRVASGGASPHPVAESPAPSPSLTGFPSSAVETPPAPDTPSDGGISPVGAGPPANHSPAEDPANCAGTLRCTSSSRVPAIVLTAIRTHLPGARIVSQSDTVELAPRRVHFRDISLSYHGAAVLVLITRPAADQLRTHQETLHDPDLTTRLLALATTAGYEIQVQFTGPPASAPSFVLVHAIASDKRLLALT